MVLALASLAPSAVAQDLATCNGEGLRRFLGKSVKAMQRVRKDNVRYVCAGCPITMDFSAERLTVIHARGRVTKMSCN